MTKLIMLHSLFNLKSIKIYAYPRKMIEKQHDEEIKKNTHKHQPTSSTAHNKFGNSHETNMKWDDKTIIII